MNGDREKMVLVFGYVKYDDQQRHQLIKEPNRMIHGKLSRANRKERTIRKGGLQD